MSNSDKPAWPAAAAFAFPPFAMPGAATKSGPPPAASLDPTHPSPGLPGADLLKSFWGSLPGASQVPGFLVPTIDVDELDRRIADLRAAETWVEVNLNLLRATIQGLEVQRHTIAALKSMSVTPAAGATAQPFDWTSLAVAPAPVPAAPEPPQPPPTAASTPSVPSASEAPAAAASLPGLAAASWLGYLQDQFAKVAGAALSGTSTGARAGAPAQSKGRRDPATDAAGRAGVARSTSVRGATKPRGNATRKPRKPSTSKG